jgi:hypothetical protein
MEQAAADVVNFAQNVAFPFDKEQTSVASKTASTDFLKLPRQD